MPIAFSRVVDGNTNMAAFERVETIAATQLRVRSARPKPYFEMVLRYAGSVRLGVALLILLGVACMIGMLVMQQNVTGFGNYFASLTPAQRLVYGRLGFFDIYHSWYFNALLSALSLNIILATLERFPKIWPFVSKPTVTVPLRWLRERSNCVSIITSVDKKPALRSISQAFREHGLGSPAVEVKNGRTFAFGQSGVWNRFMFCAVHVALLTIFLGGFLTAQLGNTGNLPLAPGQSSDLIFDTAFELDKMTEVTKQLPFTVECTDIRQILIRNDGSLAANNTIDWLTYFRITDETGTHDAFVQMNRPFDFRGYRFFQASFTPIGRARTVTIEATPVNGGETQTVELARNGNVSLADGTKLILKEFRGNFRIGPEDPNEDTSGYQNPAAILEVLPPGGVLQSATVFGPKVGEIPIAKKPVGGYTFKMNSFEKVSDQHVLSVQHDPGSNIVYVGFAMLFITLVGVFMYSHKRVWAVIDEMPDGKVEITLAGHANRNQNGFDERFERIEKAIVDEMKGQIPNE